MQKKILRLLFASSLCFATSCATNPPDKPLCVELNPWSGYCVMTMSGKDFLIDEEHKFENKTWWEQRPYMIQMPASTWEAYKAFIIKVCKKSKMCDENVSSWDRSIDVLDTSLKSKLP